jgi:hypothetical protein
VIAGASRTTLRTPGAPVLTRVAARATAPARGADPTIIAEARIAAAAATRPTDTSADVARIDARRAGEPRRGSRRGPQAEARARPKVTVERERHAPRAMSEGAKRQRQNALIRPNS